MSKNKVLLIFPDTLEKMIINVPLSLIWVAAPIVEKGYDVSILDLRMDDNYKEVVSSMAGDLVCVGVSSLTGVQLKSAIEVSMWVKEHFPEIPIVWGGWHASIMTEQTLAAPYIDYIVHGQGEIPFLELVDCLASGSDPGQIENLAYKNNGSIIVNPKRPLIDINNLPYKPYHLVDIDRYSGRRSEEGKRYLAWVSSVGCPYNCYFCADPIVYKRRWLALKAERMVDEIEYIVKTHNVEEFEFWDDNFFIDLKRVRAFVDELNRRKIKIKWTGTIRISGIIRTPIELLQDCVDSGLYMVHPGVEGATQEMLDFMNKKEKAGDTLEAARKLSSVGVKSLYSFIVGLPDEPSTNIQDTFDMVEELKKINRDNIMPVNFYTPYPGNRLFDISCERGFVPPQSLEEWSDFNTRVGITPWLTEKFRHEVMKRDKYYYPAAYPSDVMLKKMKEGGMKYIYRLLHRIAKYRVTNRNFKYDIDWKLLYAYWRFWEKNRNRLPLPNIHFRW